MTQRGDHFRLALETEPKLRVRPELGGQELDRHGPAEPRVSDLVDLAHPARPDRSDDLVRPQTSPGPQVHGVERGYTACPPRSQCELTHRRRTPEIHFVWRGVHPRSRFDC